MDRFWSVLASNRIWSRRGLDAWIGVPNGIRTRVAAVKGRCPGPLDDGDVSRNLVSPVGIEPTTNWLKASCSTTELRAREPTPYGPFPMLSTAAANDPDGAEIADRLASPMWKTFSAVFVTVFLAEIGDKTQLATLLFSSERDTNKWIVFAGSSSPLLLAAGLGVLVRAPLEHVVRRETR